MRRFEVGIVGAGPAGAATAVRLARAGVKVALIDKATFPRQKACGEGVMPHGVAELRDLGADGVICDATRSNRIEFRAPGDAVASAPLPAISGVDYLVGLERTRLDTQLVALAAEAGACLLDDHPVHALEREEAGWRITAGGGCITTRVLVVADGLHSRTRGWAGFAATAARRRRYALTTHLDGPVDTGCAVVVGLERGHEIYLTPIASDRTLVAMLLEQRALRSGEGSSSARLDALLRRSPTVASLLERAQRYDPVLATGPFSVRVPSAIAEAALLVGDAAGFTDPIAGEGISSALVSARAAAAVLLDALQHGDVSADSLAGYERWRRRFQRDHWRLAGLLLALARTPFLKGLAVRNMASRPDVFQRLLSVNCGATQLADLTPREWSGLLLGV